MFEILELVEEHLCGHSVVPFDSGYLWRGPPGHLPQDGDAKKGESTYSAATSVVPCKCRD